MKFFMYKCLCAFILLSLLSYTSYGRQQKQEGPETDTLSNKDRVNIAYGQITKKALTYSVSTVSSKDIIGNSVYLSGNSLFGKLPGLTLQQSSGEPGNDAPIFFLRGRSTMATNQPLIMVDGIERDMNDVQLEDIESITVLKDAASTIIYGIRAANGVILVTTKRGAVGKLIMNGKVEQGLLSPTRNPGFVSSGDFVKLYNQALSNDGLAPAYTPAQIAGYENGDSYYYPDVDWRKEVTNNNALGTKANFDVSGGDKIARYYVALGYFHQGGLYKNSDRNDGYSTGIYLDNVSFRSNLDLNVNKNWTFGLDLNGRVYQKNAPFTNAPTTWDMLYKYPAHLFPAYVQNGVYGGTTVYPNNPIGYINSSGYRVTNNRAILTTLSTKYDFNDLLKGLTAGLRFSTDNFYSNQEGYSKTFGVRELLGQNPSGEPVLSALIGVNGDLKTISTGGYPVNDVQNKRNTLEGNIQYTPQLGINHTLNTQLIYHQDRLIIGSESPYNYQFLSGRVNYGYLNRYYAEIGASYSGTEAFPKEHRFGFFPAVSAGWVISEENFLKHNNYLNFLKLRVSAGAVGNAEVGQRFSDLRQYTAATGYNFGSANAAQAGLYPGVAPNSNLTWETAYKYDAGIDAQLFKILDLSLTVFYEKRKNILVSEDALIPGLLGQDLPNINAGITANKGLEGSLSFAKQKKDWGYHAGVNVSYATNKITYLPETIQPYSYLYQKGNPIKQPFMLEAIGFFNSDADIQNSPVQTFGTVKPGDIKYKDQNGDKIIDAFDEVPLEKPNLPNWDMGFDVGFNFKGFDVSAFFQGQVGRSIYLGNAPFLFWPLNNNGGRINTYANQFWTEQTQNTADYPRLTTLENKNNYRESSFWYVNGDFLRLRSLELGYTLPQGLSKRARLRNARIFLRGMNLFTFDHLKYTDPEVLAGYPVMKSYNAGISLQF
ncbi:SusC/RagA family TonB-linked outer membrane protein [Pedobacter hiemivivus]|uniref:TonB-dependent receptor n=1 Tax=Pedobacter hiemivivus TaxID=2530454 RepID=A0A4V2MKJ9_9SPHI|nr:TonB-dependent receptor [Pedobacter hiemivivus]TCC98526.1 TonB-dependent receptor [Pedobacter hiemivivus]